MTPGSPWCMNFKSTGRHRLPLVISQLVTSTIRVMRAAAVLLPTLVAFGAAQASNGCPYASTTQTFNKDTMQFEVVDKTCHVLPNTTTFQAIGDISEYRGAILNYTDQTNLVDIQHATFPHTAKILILQHVGVKALGGVVWPRDLTVAYEVPDQGCVVDRVLDRALSDMTVESLPSALPPHVDLNNVELTNVSMLSTLNAMHLSLASMPNVFSLRDADWSNMDTLYLDLDDNDPKYRKCAAPTADTRIHDQRNHPNHHHLSHAQHQHIVACKFAHFQLGHGQPDVFEPQQPHPEHSDAGTSQSDDLVAGAQCTNQGGALRQLWAQQNCTVCVVSSTNDIAITPVLEKSKTTSYIVPIVGVVCTCLLIVVVVMVRRSRNRVESPNTPAYVVAKSPSTN
ncbi:Aste57867_18655 [Aphanomyces stellatus]|uniref:Aste57867_18655 protein n=1 Tax=Aphanomyces stellatus TaxID=120398 RepID=A0A485LAP9_9STRA|nr:hypothetical protein As57867_018593 [Aphanomyces stellatus]VFT95390.1 Aste57867_18655 [Aphanomyces stellatus]